MAGKQRRDSRGRFAGGGGGMSGSLSRGMKTSSSTPASKALRNKRISAGIKTVLLVGASLAISRATSSNSVTRMAHLADNSARKRRIREW